ncbi:MAG: 16S rRNA (uracil(1498)-N(3))-methyltransferase [Chitinophagaceae bacterium]|jgi:16S rRNA (uracil1498-N3)-methyltransferase|nr:16S rRNA (uracil(1498)-N(3))-methyltransferase [Chitinophagaceae bacterium]
MALPFFYIDSYESTSATLTLNEETSKHVVQVLRMKEGEQLNLTDGKGNLLTAVITSAHKKNCVVQIQAVSHQPQAERKVSIAISLVKNSSRFEWFLEKATEIGVAEIIPLICSRTERQHFRYDRMKGIVVSAMLQSQQTWLPVLHEPVKFEEYIRQTSSAEENGVLFRPTGTSDGSLKLIAHCEETQKNSITNVQIDQFEHSILLIGPEGDFTSTEIAAAITAGYQPVMLGETRLRTETAGVVGAALLCISK